MARNVSVRLSVEADKVDEVRRQLEALGATVTKIDNTRTENVRRQLEALEARLDPVARAQQRLAKDTATLDKALADGAITQERHAKLLADTKSAYDSTVQGLGAVAGAHRSVGAAVEASAGQLSQARQIVTRNLMDIGNVAVATRGDLTSMVAPMPDLIYGLRMMGGSVASVATGVLALAVPIAAVTAAQQFYLASVREVTNANQALGGSVGLTAAGFENAARAGAAAAKISVAAAHEQQAAYLRSGSVGAESMNRLIALSRDYAAATGQDLASAVKDLSDTFADPVKGSEKLTGAMNLLNGQQLAYIRSLQSSGQTEQARIALSDALNSRVKGMGDNVSVLASAWERVSRAVSDAFREVGKATAPETNEAAIKRLEAERAKLLANRGYGDPNARAIRDAELRNRGVTPPPSGVSAIDSELELRRMNEDELRRAVIRNAEGVARGKASVEGDAITRSVRPLGVEIETLTGNIAKLEKGLGSGLSGATVEGGRALEGMHNQLTDLNKVAASGLDLQTYKTQELAKVEQKYAGTVGPQRDELLAKERARIELIGTATTTTERKAAVDGAVTQVTTAQTQAVAQQTAQLSLQARGALDVADAWLKSGADAARADAMRQASLEAMTSRIDPATRAQQVLAEHAAKVAESGGQQAYQLGLQADAATRVAEASLKGVEAQHAAELQEKVGNATMAETTALEYAQGEAKDKLRRVIEAKTAAVLKEDEAQRKAAAGAILQQQRDQLELGRAELNLMGKAAVERSRTVALLQAEQQIRNQHIPTLSAEAQQIRDNAVALADQQLAIERAQSAYQELERFGEKAFDAILEKMVQTGKQTLSWGDALKAVGAELQTLALRMALINPAKNALFGTNLPTLWDLPILGGTSGGANQNGVGSGGGFSLTSPTGLGGFNTSALNGTWLDRQLGGGITSANNWLNTPMWTSSSAPVGGIGSDAAAIARTTAGPTWGNALGSVGYGLNAFQNFRSGNIVGGIGNTAAAAMMFIPGMQPFAPFVALGSQLLGGLFGPKQSSEYAGAWVDATDGTITSRASGADKTARDKVGPLEARAEASVKAVDALVKAAGLSVSGNIWIGAESDRSGSRAKIGGWGGAVVSTSDDPRQIAVDVLKHLATAAQAPGVPSLGGDADALTALKNSKATSADELVQQLQFVKNLPDTIKALAGAYGVEDAARKEAKSGVDALVSSLAEQKKLTGDLLGTTSARYAALTAAQRAYVDSLVAGTDASKARTAGEIERAKIDALWSGESAAMKAALEAVGYSVSDVTRKLGEGLANSLRQAADGLTTNLNAQIFDAQGRGYFNQLNTFSTAKEVNRRDLAALGLDSERADALFNAQVTKVLKGLSAAELDLVQHTYGTTSAIGLLVDEIKETTRATEAAARAQEVAARAAALAAYTADLQARAYAAVGNDRTASLLRLDARQAKELADAKAAGYDVSELLKVQATERGRSAFDLAVKDYTDAIDQQVRAINDNTQSARDLVSANNQFAASVRAAVADRIINKDLSPNDPLQQLRDATRLFDAAVTAAMSGDAEARSRVIGLGNTRDELSKAYYGPTAAYAADFWDTQHKLEQLGVTADDQLDAAQQQVKLADQQIKELQKAKDAANRMGERQLAASADQTEKLVQLKSVMDQSYVVWQQSLPALQAITGQNWYGNNNQVNGILNNLLSGATASTIGNYRSYFMDSAEHKTQFFKRENELGVYYGRDSYADPFGDALYSRWDGAFSDAALGYLKKLGYNGGWDANANIFLQANGYGDAFTDWIRQYGRAQGWPGFATGTDSAPPGMAWVGENGRELVQFAGGERVYTHGESMALARSWSAANDRWGSGNVLEYRRSAAPSTGTGEVVAAVNRLCDKVDALIRVTAASGDVSAGGLAEVADGVQAVARKLAVGGVRS